MSVLDLFIVCDQIMPHVVKLNVDEKSENQLRNFYGINHKGKTTKTDHTKIELEINLRFEVKKPLRKEHLISEMIIIQSSLKKYLQIQIN